MQKSEACQYLRENNITAPIHQKNITALPLIFQVGNNTRRIRLAKKVSAVRTCREFCKADELLGTSSSSSSSSSSSFRAALDTAACIKSAM